MRGRDDRAEGLFSYVRLEERVPADHPLRAIRTLADEALAALNGRFEALYSRMGRPSIPPEMLLRATLLQAFFSVRSERQLMEQIDYNLLFRWFVGLPMDAPVWHPTVFTQEPRPAAGGGCGAGVPGGADGPAAGEAAVVDEHFSVDGTLIEAWATMKSFRPKDGSRRAARAGAQRRAQLSQARSARTRPTPRPPIRMRGSTARPTARRAGCASWGMC